MTCPCTDIYWVWGDFIACNACGKRYCAPAEAAELRATSYCQRCGIPHGGDCLRKENT